MQKQRDHFLHFNKIVEVTLTLTKLSYASNILVFLLLTLNILQTFF